MARRTAGPIKTKLRIGTHVDPGSVLVKVKFKVIYLWVRYNKIHACDTWRITMKHGRSISSSSSSRAVAGATWWMLIKLLTSAGQRPARAERIRTRSAIVCSVRKTGTYSKFQIWERSIYVGGRGDFLFLFVSWTRVQLQVWPIFTVRRSALHGLCDSNSVCLSVCPSVCLSHSWTVSTRFDLRSWFLHHMVAPSF